MVVEKLVRDYLKQIHIACTIQWCDFLTFSPVSWKMELCGAQFIRSTRNTGKKIVAVNRGRTEECMAACMQGSERMNADSFTLVLGLLAFIKRLLKEGKGWRMSASEGKRRAHTLATVAHRCRSAGEGSPRVWCREEALCCMSNLFPLPDKQRFTRCVAASVIRREQSQLGLPSALLFNTDYVWSKTVAFLIKMMCVCCFRSWFIGSFFNSLPVCLAWW